MDLAIFERDQFINDLSLVEWSEILRSRGDDADHVFSTFYSKFNKILNKHAPIKILSKRRIKQVSKPWITKGMRAAIKTKNQLFYNGDNSKYKIYRNMLANLIRISKKNYYSSYFSENFNNMRKTWEGINNLLNRKRNKRKSINTLKHLNNNIVTTNKSTISNIFNEHFTTVGSKLAVKLPSSEKHFTKFLYKEKSPSSSFLFQPITPNEVKLEIMSMPVNKSHGFYSCPTFILKYACDSIKAILTDIFNLSTETRNYPSKLKMAKVIPIFKADDELDSNNYRPISLLSCFNRGQAIPLFINTKILPVNFLYYQLLAETMFDVSNNVVPTNIQELFLPLSRVHSYNTRSSKCQNFYVMKCNLEIQKNSFSRIGAKLWNHLPTEIRTSPKQKFKSKIRSLLFDILESGDTYYDLDEIILEMKKRTF